MPSHTITIRRDSGLSSFSSICLPHCLSRRVFSSAPCQRICQKILAAQAQVRVPAGAVSALPPKTDIRQRN